MLNDNLQGPMQAAMAKNQATLVPTNSTQYILAMLKQRWGHGADYITAANFAITYGINAARTAIALSGMWKTGSVSRRPNPEGRSGAYEYAYNPKYTPKAVGGAAIAAKRNAINITTKITKTYTFNIHGCSASFTGAELRELREAINIALKE